MKVISKTLNSGETSVEIDLFEGRSLTLKSRQRIQDEVGNYLVEQTLISMDEKKSPIAGEGSFAPLSKEYKKKKISEVGSDQANLEFDGVMKDETDFHPTKYGIEIGVYGERAGAADGHNNLSGNSKLPTRRFLPDIGQSYKKKFQTEVERIIADVLSEETKIRYNDFKFVESKKELYEVLSTIFGDDLSRSELQLAVYRNERLTDILGELELLKYL